MHRFLLTSRSFLPLFVLSLPLFAQRSIETPAEKLPQQVLASAQVLGVETEMRQLAALRASAPDSSAQMREVQLIQRLETRLLATELQVRSVEAKIAYESSRLNEVQNIVAQKSGSRTQLSNVANLVLGTGVGAIGNGMQISDRTAKAGTVVSAVSGTAATVLGVMALKKYHDFHTVGATPSMLAQIFGRPSMEKSEYPPTIWAYLTSPNPALPAAKTPQQYLIDEWTRVGRLNTDTPAAREADIIRLTSSGPNGIAVGAISMAKRMAMLADVGAQVESIEVHLSNALNYLAEDLRGSNLKPE